MTEETKDERQELAERICRDAGWSWESLEDDLKNACYHNADLIIAERNQGDMGRAKPGSTMITCTHCQDAGWFGDKPCPECNPVGLPVEQLHPEQALVTEPEKEKPAPVHKHFYRKGSDVCKCGHVRRKSKKAK